MLSFKTKGVVAPCYSGPETIKPTKDLSYTINQERVDALPTDHISKPEYMTSL